MQGVIFTGLTLVVLYRLKRKNPALLQDIGLRGGHSPFKRIVGLVLPFLLLLSGIATAYLVGGIENISLNLTTSVIIAILINTLTAFLYEAFPEEVFIRGLIFEELNKKFRFIISLLLQPLIFICIPIFVIGMESLFFQEPFVLTIDYVILLFTFGIALQLYRKYTGTLWTSISFHVVYLEVARYISSGGLYDQGLTLLEFDETFTGFLTLYLSFLFIVILSIVVLSVLLLVERRKRRA
nr:CPBP family intramembrane glutamic endopeptidase [Halalkalibacter oceani]